MLLAENESNYKVLELLDKSVLLIANSMKVARFLVWKPGADKKRQVVTSRIQVGTILEYETYVVQVTTPRKSLLLNMCVD